MIQHCLKGCRGSNVMDWSFVGRSPVGRRSVVGQLLVGRRSVVRQFVDRSLVDCWSVVDCHALRVITFGRVESNAHSLLPLGYYPKPISFCL